MLRSPAPGGPLAQAPRKGGLRDVDILDVERLLVLQTRLDLLKQFRSFVIACNYVCDRYLISELFDGI